jgi:hypothetical protein
MTGQRFRVHWLLAALAVVACFILGIAVRSRPLAPLPPVILMEKPYRMPVHRLTLFERWVPTTPSWAWLWKLKQAAFGSRKPINFEVLIVELAASPESSLSLPSVGSPTFTHTNGLQLWIMEDGELNELRRQLMQNHEIHLVSEARMNTADEIAASLFTGGQVVVDSATNNVGLSVDIFPRVSRGSTDLTARIFFCEAVTNEISDGTAAVPRAAVTVRTNLDLGTRCQIQAGNGLFLLNTQPEGGDGKRMGIILSAKLPGRKK